MTQSTAVWRALGDTRRGAAHDRTGAPNQDAFALWTPGGGGPPAIAVVADGHGSALHFRSGTGSRFAVETTTSVLRDVLDRFSDPVAAAIEVDAMVRGDIVARWRARVTADIAAHPFDDVEIARLTPRGGDRVVDGVVAYGSTLLAALLTTSALVLVQLGDGDILSVNSAGVAVRPFLHDARLVGNLTTSLCLPDAEVEIRVLIRPLAAFDPVLLLLSTDGYANSFVSNGDFERIGPDYLELLRTQGLAWLTSELPAFLGEASRHGAGDDITLAMLACEDLGSRSSPGPHEPTRRNDGVIAEHVAREPSAPVVPRGRSDSVEVVPPLPPPPNDDWG